MYSHREPVTRKAYPSVSKEKGQAWAKRDDYCKKSEILRSYGKKDIRIGNLSFKREVKQEIHMHKQNFKLS